MGVRQQRVNRHVRNSNDSGNRVYARNDQLAITSRDIGQFIVKQEAKQRSNALEVDVREFMYFRRRSSGRICSCMLGGENTPHEHCLICYKTGFVGGYDKYGTRTEVLDVTYPELVLVNVHPNTEDASRPTFFKLDDGAKSGKISALIPIRSSAKYVDAIEVYDNAESMEGTGSVTVVCREQGAATWVPFTATNVTQILALETTGMLEVEITLRRKSVSIQSPLFSHLYFRYGLLPKSRTIIKLDIPRNIETITFLEYGFEESFGTISMFADNKIQTYSINDFLYYTQKGKCWMLTEVQPFNALGINVSFDLTARHVQPFEVVTQIPV